MSFFPRTDCVQCGVEEGALIRYSLGIYWSRLCDKCWSQATCRKEGREGFDPMDAGESYEEVD